MGLRKIQSVFGVQNGVRDFFRASRAYHGRDACALRPNQHFVISRDDRVRFMFHIGSLWSVSDRDAHLGLPGAFAHLATLVVKPILPFAFDQASVVDKMAVEHFLIVTVGQRRISSKSFPRTVGRI